MSTATQELRRLSRRGFRPQRLFTNDGSPGALLYLRERGEFHEVVLVEGEQSAMAYRTDHRVNPDEPFRMPSNFHLWHMRGDVLTVCHALFTTAASES